MQSKGKRLLEDLKFHILDAMKSIGECQPNGSGCSYKDIQDLAGLNLDLPAQDGWLTWSVLASLAQEGKVESLRRGRRIFWRMK